MRGIELRKFEFEKAAGLRDRVKGLKMGEG
jgi:protein-arginine kinase activator protein McsA